MGDHIFLKVLGVTLLLIVAALFLPGGQPPEEYRNLPWQIKVFDDGTSQVLGVHLGSSTLEQVEQQFQEPSEVSMFATDDGKRVVEAFFNSVTLSGLKAKVVVTLGLSEAQLQNIYDRGERISTLAEGKRKISLSGEDLQKARATPVVALTYLPRTDLEESVVIKRFGQPGEKIAEPGGQKQHWLYPRKGLDVVLDQEAKDVLQYVAPRDFEKLRQPLMKHAAPGDNAVTDQG